MVRAQTTAPIPDNQRQNLLAYAISYTQHGHWPIFPLRPGTKRPAVPDHTANNCDHSDPRCNSADGHQGWEQRATTNQDRITRAWNTSPWGIGIACGPAGLVVIDLDTGGSINGTDSLRQIEADHNQQLPATFTVATPSGGRHLYYQQPPDTQIRNSAGTVAPGIDIRANGGYVVAPPTITTAGAYEVIEDRWPPELPSWFAKLLDPPTAAVPARPAPSPISPPTAAGISHVDRYVQAAVDGELDRLHQTRGGQRNHALYSAAKSLGQLVAAGALTQHDVEQVLEHAASSWYGIAGKDGGEPFTATEARQTIASGLRQGATKPRQLPTPTTRPEPVGATQ